MSGQGHANRGSIDDRQAQRWIETLKVGSPAEKAQARRGLAGIFESRGMHAEAVELLVANAREGHRDAALFRTLARLYRLLGNEYLSTSAALEATRLSGSPAPHPTTEPVPQRSSALQQDRTRGSSSGSGRSRTGSSWRIPLKVLGWLVVTGLMIGAAAIGGTSPASAVLCMLSAMLLSVLLSGSTTLRRLIFVPDGPLGNGALLFSWLLTLLAAGALLPRDQAFGPAPRAGPSGGTSPASTASVFPPGTGPSGSPVPAPTRAPAPSPIVGRVASPVVGRVVSPVAAETGAAPATSSRTSRRGAASLALGTATVTPTVAPQPTAAATSGPLLLIVIRGGTDGVLMRDAPGTGDVVKVVANGTQLAWLGVDRKENYHTWRLVRDGEGSEGWIATDYLAVESSLSPEAKALGTPTRTAFQPGYAGSAGARPSTTGAGRTVPDGAACPATHPIEANRLALGELVYHPVTAAPVVHDAPDVCFATEADARAAGYRASQR